MGAMMFTTSDSTAKIDAALAKAQGEIEHAVKDKTNPHFRSKYADLTSVWGACRDALSKNGISVTQWPIHSTDGRLHIMTRLAHAGEWMCAHFSLPVQKQDAHGYASGTTYAKRIALSAAVGVVADEDDDGNAATEGGPAKPTLRAVDPPQTSMAGRKNENEGIRAAREWVNAEAIPAVKACKTAEALNVWVAENKKRMRDVKEIAPDEFAALNHRIGLKADSFNVVAAG
jgi:hypothetical protein